MELDILAAGLNVVDVLFTQPSSMSLGEKHQVDEIRMQGGGPAGNAACAIAALGKRVGFLARMGNNALSNVAREQFRQHGVSESLFIDDPDSVPATAVVQIDPTSGERTVFYSLLGYRPVLPSDVLPDLLNCTRALLVDGYDIGLAIHLLQLARERVPSVVDLEAGNPVLLRQAMSLADHVIIPIATARRLTDETKLDRVFHAMANFSTAQLVVTDGARGSYALTISDILHVPAFNTEVVDTTGCGDAYHGAYCVGLLEKWSLRARMEFASFVASRVARAAGGRGGLTTIEADCRNNISLFSPELQKSLAVT